MPSGRSCWRHYHPDQCSVTAVMVVPVNTACQVCANSWPALLLSLAQTSIQQARGLGCLQGPYAKAFVHSAWPLHHSLTGSVAPHNAHNQQLHCNMGTILQSHRSICWLSDVIGGKAALGTKKYKSHSPIPQWARRRVTLVEQTHRDFHRRPSHCSSDLRLGASVFHGTHRHFGHSAKSVLDADQQESSWKKERDFHPSRGRREEWVSSPMTDRRQSPPQMGSPKRIAASSTRSFCVTLKEWTISGVFQSREKKIQQERQVTLTQERSAESRVAIQLHLASSVAMDDRFCETRLYLIRILSAIYSHSTDYSSYFAIFYRLLVNNLLLNSE